MPTTEVLPEILPGGMEPCGRYWFRDGKEARVQIAHMKPIKGPGYALTAFYCYDCDGFHIGHVRMKR